MQATWEYTNESRVAHKCHYNYFNLTHGNFNFFTLISIYSQQSQFTHSNFNLLLAISICSRQLQFTLGNAHMIFRFAFALLTTCHLRRLTGTSSDQCEFVSVCIHFFSCVYMDRPQNELRPVWCHLRHWPDTIYVCSGLRLYCSHVKQKTNLRPGP